MVTYHPETLGHASPESVLNNLLDAIDCFPEAKIILTYPNADTFDRKLISQIKEYADERPNRVLISSSLGQLLYLSALKEVDLVIGNSSSGITEAPITIKIMKNIL